MQPIAHFSGIPPIPPARPTGPQPLPPPAPVQAFNAPPRWAPPQAALEPELWFWVQGLREFAPLTAAIGMGAGVLIGLAAGTPALGAAWGACIVTGIPGIAIALGTYGVPLVRSLLRGDGLGRTPLRDLSFAGGVLLPTAAVAVGSALAVGTNALAFGGLLGAITLFGAGRLWRRLTRR
ncbi:MAG: hypothetical protein VKN33_03680 [Candidatus Sericytochromatia bacterium]|nr:hypothetical protein [Candidatus Sericytochromatia bacterium]